MKRTTKRFEDKLLWFAISFSSLFWITDSTLEAFVLNEDSLFRHLYSPDLNETWMRFFIVFGMIGFGEAAQRAVTKLKKRKEINADSEALFRSIFDHSNDAILVIDPAHDEILEVNKRACQMLGFSRKDLRSKHISEIHSDKLFELQAFVISVFEKGRVLTDKLTCRTKSGTLFPAEVSASSIEIDGKTCIIASIRDITARKRFEEQNSLSTIVFKTAKEGIIITDSKGKILSINPVFSEISGYTSAEVIGKSPSIFQSGRHGKAYYEKMWNGLNKTGHWEGEIWNRRKNGELYLNWLSITAIRDEKGEVTQYTALYSNMPQRKTDEDSLHYQAYYDPLTELPNRNLALELLSQTIKRTRRNGEKAALLLLDLDRFKQVNDTLGYPGGDKILQQVVKRLLSCLRETDTIARIRGDKFLIILPNSIRRNGPAIVAKKVIENISEPFNLDGRDIFLSMNIGITIVPDDGDEVSVLLKNADTAMYKAKTTGNNKFCLFREAMGKAVKARALLEWDLRRAPMNKEFVLHYQPVIDLGTSETTTLEALVRWNHPNEGLLPPGRFIAVAEESDLINLMGEWILETACIQCKVWQDQYGYKGSINVNVSTRQIVDSDFQSSLVNALNKSGLPAECLTLEVTESLMLDPNEDPIGKLKDLKTLGVKLAIDDFGTGYSSLSYLWRYPIDHLKIDRSFVFDIQSDENKQHLVKAIIRMGQSMKMKVIAEGVETVEDLKWLEESGCDEAQGYYFSKPIPAENYESTLKATAKNSSTDLLS